MFGLWLETWLGMQMAYDLWQVRDRVDQIAVASWTTHKRAESGL